MSESYVSLNPAPLNTQVVGSRVLLFPVVDSTNDRAFAVATDGAVIIADRQTAGRGRRGRSWASAAGRGLWFSIFFEGDLPGLPFIGPLAVVEALTRLYPDAADALRGKWPNDLLLRGKKFCGCLVEKRSCGSVLGLGVNVLHRREDFPEDLQGSATSLFQELNWAPRRSDLFRAILEAIDKWVVALRADPFQADTASREWFDFCRLRGGVATWHEGQGIIEGVDSLGTLYVRQGDRVATVLYGDSVQVFSLNSSDAA